MASRVPKIKNNVFIKGYNDSFRKQYTDMHKENETLCLGLLDEIRTQTEGAILMNHKSSKNMAQHCSLSFVQVLISHWHCIDKQRDLNI